jgi:queuine tRNA-ribosyltransferase
MRAQALNLRSGSLPLPAFLPDATWGVVRTVDAADLERVGVDALVMNTFHLSQKPGSTSIQALGGLHRMTGWTKAITTDSGGFQAYSLIRQNPKFGQLHEKGITFYPEGSQRKYQFTPEKVIQLQLGFDSDIVICLDDCTHVDEGYDAQKQAVERTINWARQSKKEYDKILAQKKLPPSGRPLIFAVIQGGGFKDLRLRCAEALLEIGFDGFGYGGWPLDKDNQLLTEIIGYTREVIPSEFPMHALGIGHPLNVLASYELGYDLFDSAMPTRDARHGRLYKFNYSEDAPRAGLSGDWFSFVYADNERNIRSNTPVSEFCDCPLCSRYSLGYLHHLFKQGDPLFMRLATLHNLRFMTQLTERIRRQANHA